MREILFRGKRIESKEWIYGNFLQDKDLEEYLIEFFDYYSDSNGRQRDYCQYKVAPETVGQYTGLTDKNGTKIFEGDIIKTQPYYDRPYSNKRKSKQFLGIVKFKTSIFNGNKSYNTQVYKAEWCVEFLEDFGKYRHSFWSDFWDCEVIGNIHDNPELLKGGVDNA